jgi:hypothetical protein
MVDDKQVWPVPGGLGIYTYLIKVLPDGSILIIEAKRTSKGGVDKNGPEVIVEIDPRQAERLQNRLRIAKSEPLSPEGKATREMMLDALRKLEEINKLTSSDNIGKNQT